MNIRQELLTVIEQLPDQQLSTLLELALCLKGTKNSVEVSQANHPIIESEAHQDWVSAKNDVYDQPFAGSEYVEPHSNRRAFLKLPVPQRNALLSQQAATVEEHFRPGAEGMEWTDEYVEDQSMDDE